ncbi:outer membrane beta-barrel protein [Aeromonas dhakensis]|uniref:outer membrane beta-barrel protein n=1 Tax=Aeromonas dhakensis TaxID=196024 RepID=UPI001A8C3C5A|nr:outer membrane beta-barrel protein [Aeromonas dhakensis]QSR45185.1 outer membrane beta-barrel protein [Aeromonas dhakensis]
MVSQVTNWYLILTAFVLGIGTVSISHANENFLSVGTQEIGVQGSVDFNYSDKYQVLLNTNYGYFIDDGWEIGGDMDVNATKSYKSAAVGIFTEYNLVNSSNLTPYIGVGTQLLTANYNDAENHSSTDSFDATAMNFKLSTGVKYFVNKNVALTAEVNHNIATDDLHMSGGDPKHSLTKFLIGTKFYF